MKGGRHPFKFLNSFWNARPRVSPARKTSRENHMTHCPLLDRVAAAGLALGLLTSAAAAETKTLKIAYEGALTGPVAFYGVPSGNAVQLAIAQAKDEMTKLGVDLQYVPADDQVDAAQA